MITHLVELVGASPWIASFLGRHPVLLDELLDVRTSIVRRKGGGLESELRHRLAGVDDDDLEYQMEVLRVFKQVNVLHMFTTHTGVGILFEADMCLRPSGRTPGLGSTKPSFGPGVSLETLP